jgi:hypothetical protein
MQLLYLFLLVMLIFWFIQFVNMEQTKMDKKERAIWRILFVGLSGLTAIFWWFSKR